MSGLCEAAGLARPLATVKGEICEDGLRAMEDAPLLRLVGWAVGSERKTGVKHAEVITARLVQDDRGWLRLAG
jgi:hypothetical protein